MKEFTQEEIHEIDIRLTSDADVLASLNEEVQKLHHQLHPEVFKPYSQTGVKVFYEAALENKNNKAFVAFKDETPVGYVLMMVKDLPENPFQYSRRFVELDQIVVLEKNKGVGQMLVEQVIAETRLLGIKRIELSHWTLNETARRFFNRQGFIYFHERMGMDL